MNGKNCGLTAEGIEKAFGGTADLCRREVCVGGLEGSLFFIDGLTAGGDIAETVLKYRIIDYLTFTPVLHKIGLLKCSELMRYR